MEKRIARLEARVQFMEDRRKALIPPELDNDPNVKLVLRDSLDGFTAKLQSFAAQKDVDEVQTRFNIARQKAHEQFERTAKKAEEREKAELVAAIEYYERTGQSPPGYDISG
jgi:hypothetical protein